MNQGEGILELGFWRYRNLLVRPSVYPARLSISSEIVKIVRHGLAMLHHNEMVLSALCAIDVGPDANNKPVLVSNDSTAGDVHPWLR